MKIRDYLGISKRRQHQLSRLMQVSLVLMVLIGLYLRNMGVVVNALVGLVVTFLPGILERDHEITMDPAVVLWISSAVFFHALGTLGPYKTVWWWDHFTHMLSSSVVAGAGYATLRALDKHHEELYFPPRIFFVFILMFVIAFGVIWELIEFGISGAAELAGVKTVLTQYGLDDTMKDLVFDILGGVAVAVSGEAYLLDVTGQIQEKLAD